MSRICFELVSGQFPLFSCFEAAPLNSERKVSAPSGQKTQEKAINDGIDSLELGLKHLKLGSP